MTMINVKLKLLIGLQFSATQWLDEPISLPVLAEYIHPIQQRQPLKIEQTAQLLREFDSVLDSVELTHLTPPQTPPESPQCENLNDLKLVTIISGKCKFHSKLIECLTSLH